MMFASMAERERFRPKVKPKNFRRDIRKMPLSFSFFWHGWTRMDTVFALENSVYSVAIRA